MSLKKILREVTIFTFILCFTFTAVYVPQHYRTANNTVLAAPAQEATQQINTNNNILTRIEAGINNTLTAGIANITSLQWWYDTVINKMGWALAKAILAAIMRDIANWVRNGFQGSPAFIQDLGGFLTDVADQTAGRFLEELGGPFSIICSPFRVNIRIALAVSYNRTRSPRSCTLSGALQNVQNFVGDFRQGGWKSWIDITQSPGSTQAGGLLEASAEMGIQISNSRQRQETTANWGRGFLSRRVCDEPQSPTAQQVAQGQGASQGQQAAGGRNCRIITPGQVISTQINETLNLGTDSLIEADAINEVIGAFMQQMVVGVVTGARGLLGAGDSGNPGGGFDVNNYTRGSESLFDATAARNNMTQSLAAATKYLQLAQTTINKYENGYTTDPSAEARAKVAYDEARSALPGLQNSVTTLQGIIVDFDATSTDQARFAVLNRYTSIITNIPTQEVVSGQEVRWNYAMSGLSPRTEGTLDRRTMTDQVTLERSYLRLINAALAAYDLLTNPQSSQTTAFEFAETELPRVQNNIILVKDLIEQFDAGNTEDALSSYAALKDDLTTENDIEKAQLDWEKAFGPLE